MCIRDRQIHINANITDTSINDNDSIEFYVGNSEAITVKRTSENEKVDESGYNVTLAIPLDVYKRQI